MLPTGQFLLSGKYQVFVRLVSSAKPFGAVSCKQNKLSLFGLEQIVKGEALGSWVYLLKESGLDSKFAP